MRYTFLFLTLLGMLRASQITPLDAVYLAKDAYLVPKNFKAKYEKPKNKLFAKSYNGVEYFIIKERHRVLVTFRGTATKRNITTDAHIKHVKFLSVEGSLVHVGFYSVALNSYEVVKNIATKDDNIIISGHSLGGGVGLLLGAILYKKGYKNVEVYSFGMPPIGNDVFVKSIEKLQHQRYVNEFDIVPKINKPIANKIKKIVVYIKDNGFLSKSKNIASLAFNKAFTELSNIPYEFIHQSKAIVLTKPIPYKHSKNFFKNLFNKLVASHKIDSYVIVLS